MKSIDVIVEKLNMAEHVLKMVSECTNCPSCKALGVQYFEHEKLIEEHKSTNTTTINIEQNIK